MQGPVATLPRSIVATLAQAGSLSYVAELDDLGYVFLDCALRDPGPDAR